MKRPMGVPLSLFLALALLVAGCEVHRRGRGPRYESAGAVVAAPDLPPETAPADLIQLEQQRSEAVSQGDAFALEALLGDDFLELSAGGQRRTRKQVLQRLREAASEAHMTERLDPDDLEVRLFGDFAVVMGRLHVEGARYHAERFTHVWRWKKDTWQMVSAHASSVPLRTPQ